MQKLQKEFFMDKSNLEFEDLEKICREVISRVLHTCELELLNNNDEVKALPFAAMAVKESILTFLALINSKKT